MRSRDCCFEKMEFISPVSLEATDDDNDSSCSEMSFVRREEADDEDWTVVSQPPEVTSQQPEASLELGGPVEMASPDQDVQDMPPLEDDVEPEPEVASLEVEKKPEILVPLGPEETRETEAPAVSRSKLS